MGQKILARPYYSQRAVFASPLSAFFIFILLMDSHLRVQADVQIRLFLGNIRPAEDIMGNLQHILADTTAAPSHPVGYLTAETRDLWSSARDKLVAAGLFHCSFYSF